MNQNFTRILRPTIFLTLIVVLASCGGSQKVVLSFAGLSRSKAMTEMKLWGSYDTVEHLNAIDQIAFQGIRLPGGVDTCGVFLSFKNDTVVEVNCLKFSRPGSVFKFPMPAHASISDFERWDSLLTLELGPPADSIVEDSSTYLYWKGERETVLRYHPPYILKGEQIFRQLGFRSFWKREMRDGKVYRKSDLLY